MAEVCGTTRGAGNNRAYEDAVNTRIDGELQVCNTPNGIIILKDVQNNGGQIEPFPLNILFEYVLPLLYKSLI